MGLLFYTIFLFFYSAGLRLASLWNPKARKWVRGRRNFPEFNFSPDDKVIWMHCASLGEFEQGRPLLEALKKDIKFNQQDLKLVVSFFSPSGYEIMKNYPLADKIIYLPMDSPLSAHRLIRKMAPSLVLWVKYEFWHYYLSELKRKSIPVLLVSGVFRPDQPFFKWYGGFWRKMLSNFTTLFLQNESSVDLARSIGLSQEIVITGDTRFDRVIEITHVEAGFREIEAWCAGHNVIVAGSTWEEDEAEWVHYMKANPETRLIIAPHEVDKENLKDVQHSFKGSIFYSSLLKDDSIGETSNVLIIDNVGMLSKLYRYGSIAYIGGGFGDDGVHNVLEAAVYGIPVIHGPEYDKYAEAVELVECEGAFVIESAVELEKILVKLFETPGLLKHHGDLAKDYVHQKAGATKKIMDAIYEKRLLTN